MNIVLMIKTNQKILIVNRDKPKIQSNGIV